MTDFTIISKFRNKERVQALVSALRERGKTCYDFCELPADAENPDADPEKQMEGHEAVDNFYDDSHFKSMFESDVDAIRNADKVIMMLPAGNSVHIEAGIAYGLGKKVVLIGKPDKAESIYLIFTERYVNEEEFLESLD
jgi:nucleoside 2-deoxyribosyltransferase